MSIDKNSIFPLSTKCQSYSTYTVCSFMAVGDVVSQNIERRIFKIDRKYDYYRTARMGIWGMMVGPLLTGWYKILGRYFDVKIKQQLVLKVITDQTVWAPLNMLTFFGYCGLTEVEENRVEHSKEKIKNHLLPTLKTNWCIWPLIQFVNFNFIAIRNQVLFVNFFSIIWSVYLSYQGNKVKKVENYFFVWLLHLYSAIFYSFRAPQTLPV